MELNGAVLGNRLKNFLKKETSFEFENVYQLVDSSTVLGYVQKECGSFKPFRVAEIQNKTYLKMKSLLDEPGLLVTSINLTGAPSSGRFKIC